MGQASEEFSRRHPVHKTILLGWIIGLFPVKPDSIENFKFRSYNFAWLCIQTCITVAFDWVVNLLTYLQIITTPSIFPTDKINALIKVSATSCSNIGIRCGFLIRTSDFVNLMKMIREYNLKYRPKIQTRNSTALISYACFILLCFSYTSWIGAMAYRNLRAFSHGTSVVTFLPTGNYGEGFAIANAITTAFFVLSSFYTTVLLIWCSYILLEYLADFKTNLQSSLELYLLFPPSGKTTEENIIHVKSTENSRTVTPIWDSEGPPKNYASAKATTQVTVTHMQLSELKKMFQKFNNVIGISITYSLVGDLLIIISLFYSLFSKFADFHVTRKYVEGSEGQDSQLDFITAASEVEYELRLFITAYIGSRVVNQINKHKTEIDEVLYLLEIPVRLSNDNVVSICNRLLSWRFHLDAMGIVNIDLRLLPAMIGTVLSYVIILLQIHVAERSGYDASAQSYANFIFS